MYYISKVLKCLFNYIIDMKNIVKVLSKTTLILRALFIGLKIA